MEFLWLCDISKSWKYCRNFQCLYGNARRENVLIGTSYLQFKQRGGYSFEDGRSSRDGNLGKYKVNA